MTAFVLRRLLRAVPVVLGVVTALFILIQMAPGDPVDLLAPPEAPAQVREQMRRNFGLDAPLPIRYVRWVTQMAKGDLGVSYRRGRPVREVLAGALPNTLLLGGVSLLLAFGGGILTGTLQAVRPRGRLDRTLSGVTLFLYSVPTFWLAILLMLFFSYYGPAWGLPFSLPPSGVVGVNHELMNGWGRLMDRARHLILPALTLALVMGSSVARFARSGVIEAMEQDYVRTARAKGLSERRVLLHHGLRNGILPVVSVFGLYFPVILGGTVLIETVFAWPGMGSLMVSSILARDYYVVVAAGLIFAIVVVIGNLLADVLLFLLDPRLADG